MRTLRRLLGFKNVVAVMATVTGLVLAAAMPTVALAVDGHGASSGHGGVQGHWSGGGHPSHPVFTGRPSHGWVVGHPGHPRFVRGPRGFVVVAPGFGWWPGYPYYGVAPSYEPTPSGYWYYCSSAGAYYPYVESCPEPWVPVPSG